MPDWRKWQEFMDSPEGPMKDAEEGDGREI